MKHPIEIIDFIVRCIGYVVAAVLVFAIVVVLVTELFSGCGETYIDAHGVRHKHDCQVLAPEEKQILKDAIDNK